MWRAPRASRRRLQLQPAVRTRDPCRAVRRGTVSVRDRDRVAHQTTEEARTTESSSNKARACNGEATENLSCHFCATTVVVAPRPPWTTGTSRVSAFPFRSRAEKSTRRCGEKIDRFSATQAKVASRFRFVTPPLSPSRAWHATTTVQRRAVSRTATPEPRVSRKSRGAVMRSRRARASSFRDIFATAFDGGRSAVARRLLHRARWEDC